MTALAQTLRRVIRRGRPEPETVPVPRPEPLQVPESPPVDIAPDDPIIGYLQSVAGAVDLDSLALESPARTALRAAGVKLVVPLVSQGELIGLLNLGPRLSQQEYSGDDRRLLDSLAAQAAPAVRVAQLVRAQEAEARARERIEQELQVARTIQLSLLPKEMPALPGWELAAHYQPARAVGGDFYDFIQLSAGRLGLVVGDVTDKGVPAALLMATTRSVLRSVATQTRSPGQVLERVNNLLCPDAPPHMFVTCLYAVLDPATGHLTYANAGHNVPYVSTAGGVVELRARGLPLGLMPGMQYEEKAAVLAPGEHVLFHSDGVAEAHDPRREMFGFPRLKRIVAESAGGELIGCLLAELRRFTGDAWEQEDDVTLVMLRRCEAPAPDRIGPAAAESSDLTGVPAAIAADGAGRVLADFTVRSEPGNERVVMERVAGAVRTLDLPPLRLERLKTAVAEATMNAIEHGNENRPELPVAITVLASPSRLVVRVTDHGGGKPIPAAEVPDIEAKIAGRQKARGWGLFLIQNMVDEMSTRSGETHHTIELTLHLDGSGRGDASL